MVKETILKVGTAEAVKSVGDLRKNIQELKKTLNGWTEIVEEDGQKVKKTFEGLEIGTKEYQDTLDQLKINQNALRDAMYATTASFEDVTNAATGANIAFKDNNELVTMEGVSYNALVHSLADLKQAWRATTDEAERAELGERINNVNDKLKEMDKSVGNYSRNVGNYIGAVDHLTAGLGSMGKGAQGLISPIKGATSALKTMSATPAVAILGILASVLQKIIEGLKSSEENTEAMTAALSPFKAISDGVTKVLQLLGSVVVSLVSGFAKLTSAIFGTNEATKQRIALAQEEAQLNKQQRETIIANAEAEREVARLRAEAADKSKTTASQRIALLEEAGEKERQIAERALQDAQLQYQIIKRRNSLTQSSKEALDEEANAYAAMVKAETAYYNQVRTIQTGINAARRQEAKEARDTAKAVKEAATAKINAEKDYLTQLLGVVRSGSESQFKIQNTIAKKEYEAAVASAKQKITDQKELNRTLELLQKAFLVKLQKNRQDYDNATVSEEILALQNRAEAFRRGSVEYLAAQEEVAQKSLDSLRRQMDETDAEWQARQLAARRALKEAQDATTDAIIGEARQALTNEMNGLREGSVEQLTKAVELAQFELDSLYQGIDETADQFRARQIEAEKALVSAREALRENETDDIRLEYENRITALQDGSFAQLEAEKALKKFELDSLHQLEDESNEEFRARQLEAEKAYYEAKKALQKQWLDTLSQVASGASSILGSIADAMEENTEITEAEAKRAKNLRIASATIDMLQGAVTAYAGAQTLGVPMGPIVGSINAAAVIATGLANIAKIKAQQVSADNSSSETPVTPAIVSAPTIEPTVPEVRNLTSASEEDRLNRMASAQRVYILNSDIEAADNTHRVQVRESTF